MCTGAYSLACLVGIGMCLSGCGAIEIGPAPAHGTFRAVAPDVLPRYFHRASLLADGRVMVSGGLTATVIPPALVTVDTISFFDPSANQFSATFRPNGAVGQASGAAAVTPRLHLARSSHTQTTLADGRVLITGGDMAATGARPGPPTATCEIFDPASGLVTTGPAMNQARSFHTATRLTDGRVVVAGGATWQVFTPADDTWSAGLPLARPRLRHAAVPLPGHFGGGAGGATCDGVLLIGGSSAGDTLELLDPHGMTATLYDARLPVSILDLAAARLEDGRVLIAGGQRTDSGDTISDTLLFDPANGDLTPLTPPPGASGGFGDHAMLTFGRHVAVFGGEQERGDADTELKRALVFDSDAMAWVDELDMHFSHDDFPAVRLDDARAVLIGGGTGLFGVPVPTANVEIFQVEGMRD